ncbi:hypothetical protein MPER_06037 [Moniliophthora perniciosa FA553]|nr:hypothetical protein MPER_06037 [Moniliophthora perniciosa FA553]
MLTQLLAQGNMIVLDRVGTYLMMEALVEDDEPPDDDYERDSFLASDNEDIHFEGNQNTKGEGVDDGSDDPFSDSEVFDPSEVLAGNPAVANGVLDVAIQDPATQAMYSELGMKVIPSKITLMVQMVAKTKERPNVAHINYGRLRDGLSNDVARGQLKSVLSFNKHGEFANLGHIDTSRYQYVKDCFYTKDPATGLPDAPAVFLLPAVSAQSLLNVNFDETSQWADSFARKLYVKTFRQEFKLLEAACGELLGASIYHGPIANDGSLLFQTKKKK